MPTALLATDTRLSLDDALRDLIDAYEVAGRSERTVAIFRHHVTKFGDFMAEDLASGHEDFSGDWEKSGLPPVLREVPLDQITAQHVTRFLAHERKRGLKPASLSVALRTLRTFFAYWVARGAI